MTPAQAAYRAGCIVCEVEARFARDGHLTPTTLVNCSRLPFRVPVFLRHLWPKAVKEPAVLALLDGWECPDRPFADAERGPFWIGYYHQKVARTLPSGVGGRIKALREQAGLSVADLADRVGLSRQQVYNLEADVHKPSWDVVQRVADVFGVSTETFRQTAAKGVAGDD